MTLSATAIKAMPEQVWLPVGTAVRKVEEILSAASIATARLDAELIMADVLGMTRTGLYVHWNDTFPGEMMSRVLDWARRRAAREPLQYLRGVQEFYSKNFRVNKDVLIPRPETESLIDLVRKALDDRHGPLRVADVGTGSGCIAVTLARLFPQAEVFATDISPAALSMARANAQTHGAKVKFLETDLLSCFKDEPEFDVIASNPPYVAENDRATLQREVVEHEPALALFGGPDGLDVIRRLVREAIGRLRPGGWFCMEMGCEQAAAVSDLAQEAGFQEIAVRQDLARLDRFLLARRP